MDCVLCNLDWKMLSRVALVGALSAIAYYYIEQHAKRIIGK